MIDTQRLVNIIEEAKKRKTATWPQCCPWSLASSPEIEQMAQELLEIRTRPVPLEVKQFNAIPQSVIEALPTKQQTEEWVPSELKSPLSQEAADALTAEHLKQAAKELEKVSIKPDENDMIEIPDSGK